MKIVKAYALGSCVVGALEVLDSSVALLHRGFVDTFNWVVSGIEFLWVFISIAAIVVFLRHKAPLLSPISFLVYNVLGWITGAVLFSTGAITTSSVSLPDWVLWMALGFGIYYVIVNLLLSKRFNEVS